MKHMNGSKYTSERLTKVLSLSLSLAAVIFFTRTLPALAGGGGGGMGGMGGGMVMSSMGYGGFGANYGAGYGVPVVTTGYNPAGYAMSYGYGAAGIGPGYGSGYTIPTTTFVPTTNTAAMFSGLGTGLGTWGGQSGTSAVPSWGQNNVFGNAYGTTFSMPALTQTTSGTYGMSNTGMNNYGMSGSGDIYRQDQGHMMSGHHAMNWGINQPVVTTPDTIVTSPAGTTVITTSQPVSSGAPGGNPMPYANAINDLGVAGYMTGLGTANPTFTPRASAAASTSWGSSFGAPGTFLPYGSVNQYGYTYGSPWL
ncbi:MAG: hypothetical protein AB1611_04945 [bacterium]